MADMAKSLMGKGAIGSMLFDDDDNDNGTKSKKKEPAAVRPKPRPKSNMLT